MSDKKPIEKGYQPAHEGYKPKTPVPTGDRVHGGYQPETSQKKTERTPPPKKL
ncbi:hypothetical protein HMI48_05330 [Acidithiobacillus ferrooxidans]|uniref:hypothetical protein n=1 Tax=Acidithiobacillus ferrooxidans TaxID=920 RepID=UPI001C06979D|nr:hypothetical protein [Acidithiobacillus ferrooxidans]MBU2773347.1 hypothetical protein [Acidithiobacillus ferrooxidans]